MGLPLVLGGLSAAQGIIKMIQSGDQKRKFNKLIDAQGTYQSDPSVEGNLSLAQNAYNGRMAGAAALEKNILASQATASDAVRRSSTDSSQVLALAAGLQGNTNASLGQLAIQEEASRAQRFGQVQSAVAMMNQEKTKEWQDELRKLNMKLGVKAAHYDNINSGVGDIVSGGGMAIQGIMDSVGSIMGGGVGKSVGGSGLSGGILGEFKKA